MILIVDDCEAIATSLARLLRQYGYDTEWACDGVAAMERLGREPVPALVVLDYQMPRADGLEVLLFIRAQTLTAKVPVIMASGALKTCPAGAQVLLLKPFEVTLLLASVRQLHQSPWSNIL
jgi:DNA-binding response OmpR family regulator